MDARNGGKIAGASGLALILIMFLFAWYSVGGANINGLDAFDAYSDWVGLILVFAAFAGMTLALVGSSNTQVGLPVALSSLTAGLGVVGAIVVLIYIISPPSVSFGAPGSVGLDREIGCWLGLIASIGIAYGGWQAMQEEGQSRPSRRERPRYSTEAPPPSEPPAGPPMD